MSGAVRILFFIFMLAIIWSPVPFGSNRPWAWSLLEVVLFSLFVSILFFWLIGVHKLPESIRQSKLVLLVLLLWVMFPLLQVLPIPVDIVQLISPKTIEIFRLAHPGELPAALSLSIDVERTLEVMMKNATYAVAFFITVYCCYSAERQRATLISITVVATLFSIWVVSNVAVGVVNTGSYDHVTGSFANKNHFSAFVNMGIAAAVGIILSAGLSERRAENRQSTRSLILARLMDWRWHMVAYTSVLVVTLLITMSRGAWISLIVSMIIVLAIINTSQNNREWHFSTFVMLLLVMGLTMLLAGGEMLIQRFSDLSEDAVGRTAIWQNSIEIIKAFPLTGVGAGNYQYIYPLFDDGRVADFVDHAHNDYIQMLVEQGPVSLLLLLVLVLLCFRQGIRAIRMNHSMTRSAFGAASILGCLVMLIHGMVDFNFQIPSNALYFFVFLALAHISGMPANIGERRRRPRRGTDRAGAGYARRNAIS